MAKHQNQAANTGKNSAPAAEQYDEKAMIEAALAAFEAEGGVEVKGSVFAPYLKPYVGLVVKFQPVFFDDRDPNFVRYNCINLFGKPLACATGKVKDAEVVEVPHEGIFAISKYASLPLEQMLGLTVFAICDGEQELPPKDGKPRSPMFTFKFKMNENDAETFKARQKEFAQAQNRAALAAKANAAGALPVTRTGNGGAQASLPG